jgi:Zn-dependent peptidase ImmA (M78 family)
MLEMGRELNSSLRAAQISENPDRIAREERGRFGIEVQQQLDWPNEYAAFNVWRSCLESVKILVFQFPMPVEDARGFSLSETEPFAITVSSSDAMTARIFTLFHEYAHLLLRRPGICVPEEQPGRHDPFGRVERWCNQFSAALLVPQEALERVIRSHAGPPSDEDLPEFLRSASRQLKVSRHVVLRRMADLGLVQQSEYRRQMAKLQSERRRARKGGGRTEPGKKCVREHGSLFTSLVLEAKARNLIPYTDVSDYLSVGLKYLGDVQSALGPVAA